MPVSKIKSIKQIKQPILITAGRIPISTYKIQRFKNKREALLRLTGKIQEEISNLYYSRKYYNSGYRYKAVRLAQEVVKIYKEHQEDIQDLKDIHDTTKDLYQFIHGSMEAHDNDTKKVAKDIAAKVVTDLSVSQFISKDEKLINR